LGTVLRRALARLPFAKTTYGHALRIARVLALLRHRVSSSAGFEARLAERLHTREEHFLRSAEDYVFAYQDSPYRPLFDLAAYDMPRLRQLVAARGLEGALEQLQEDGVFIRIQEFKGTEPVRRRGHLLRFEPRHFANPSVRGVVQAQSSGSRSGGTPSAISLEDFLEHVRLRRWVHEHYGLIARDIVLWTTVLSGLNATLQYTVRGQPPLRWFSFGKPADRLTPVLIALARAVTRRPVPYPISMFPNAVSDLAAFISRASRSRGILFQAFVNPALRLVIAAEEGGISLGDVVFVVDGEPLTPLKRRQFEQRGYPVLTSYGFSELGSLAWSCPDAVEPDDVHVFTDRVAVRRYPRAVGPDGDTVPAYLFTSLMAHARHIMINMESGDYGALEERACGCFLDRAGLRLHMHTIRSFEKLTAEGMTFIGPDLIVLLEEVLPREFGGDSRHYQLVEAEDQVGITRLYVLVSPRVGLVDEAALRRTVLREIAERHIAAASGQQIQRIWERADTVRVLRRDPLATAAGKILHLHRDRGMLRAELLESPAGAD